MEGHTAQAYHKMEPTNSVRRPESGTWQSLAMKSAALEAARNLPAPYDKNRNHQQCEET
ncbi:unnamed protein product [Staurois parvus]|uniref:Uncharacterized protein n=1 Tax=Staurois parvus TaxID=386267 RepID=A0ABN9AYC3_9NEOB|nr:unnamed protein product [Staurois parvus]